MIQPLLIGRRRGDNLHQLLLLQFGCCKLLFCVDPFSQLSLDGFGVIQGVTELSRQRSEASGDEIGLRCQFVGFREAIDKSESASLLLADLLDLVLAQDHDRPEPRRRLRLFVGGPCHDELVSIQFERDRHAS